MYPNCILLFVFFLSKKLMVVFIILTVCFCFCVVCLQLSRSSLLAELVRNSHYADYSHHLKPNFFEYKFNSFFAIVTLHYFDVNGIDFFFEYFIFVKIF